MVHTNSGGSVHNDSHRSKNDQSQTMMELYRKYAANLKIGTAVALHIAGSKYHGMDAAMFLIFSKSYIFVIILACSNAVVNNY